MYYNRACNERSSEQVLEKKYRVGVPVPRVVCDRGPCKDCNRHHNREEDEHALGWLARVVALAHNGDIDEDLRGVSALGGAAAQPLSHLETGAQDDTNVVGRIAAAPERHHERHRQGLGGYK